MSKRKGFHWSDLQDDAKVRPVRWPDELCEKCIAPDCNHIGPLWTCPWRKNMEADNGEAEQR